MNRPLESRDDLPFVFSLPLPPPVHLTRPDDRERAAREAVDALIAAILRRQEGQR
jgi:hypothetical protein